MWRAPAAPSSQVNLHKRVRIRSALAISCRHQKCQRLYREINKRNSVLSKVLKYCFLGINSFCQNSFAYSLVKSLLKTHLFWGSQVLICIHHVITFAVYKERDLHLALRSPTAWVSSLIIFFLYSLFCKCGEAEHPLLSFTVPAILSAHKEQIVTVEPFPVLLFQW